MAYEGYDRNIKTLGFLKTNKRTLLGDHNLIPYNHSKNKLAYCDVEYHKRFKCVFLITN